MYLLLSKLILYFDQTEESIDYMMFLKVLFFFFFFLLHSPYRSEIASTRYFKEAILRNPQCFPKRYKHYLIFENNKEYCKLYLLFLVI